MVEWNLEGATGPRTQEDEMAKKIDPRSIARSKEQPRTGDGVKGSRVKPKGVIFRKADGKPAIPEKAGKASRLRIPRWLGGSGN